MNWHAVLAHFPKITYARYRRLAAYFFNLEKIWEAEFDELIQAGLDEAIAHEFIMWREQNSPEKIMTRLAEENINVVSLPDQNYPPLLKEISDPPHTLFYRGTLPPAEQPTIAIVGTRRLTNYGKLVCEEIAYQLAEQGLIIVSGLALGIDGISHQSALQAKGLTYAILGSSVERKKIYPGRHVPLAEEIIKHGGGVISEYPPGFTPTQYSFPARNRIIAGLSLGTLVIEAPTESGALITARAALDYNREVMAIPHPVTSMTGAGNNQLLKIGARVITSAADVLEVLNLQSLKKISTTKKQPTNETEEKILTTLTNETKTIDAIIKETGLPSASVSSTLMLLEMKGMVKNLGGATYLVR